MDRAASQRIISGLLAVALAVVSAAQARAQQSLPTVGRNSTPVRSEDQLDGVDRDGSDLAITSAPAQRPGGLRPMAGRLAIDVLDLAKVPVRADARQWGKFALALGLIGAASQSDESLRRSLDPEVKSDLANTIRPIGQEAGLLFVGASLALGHMADKPRVAALGRDGLEATVLAAGIIAPVLKNLVGRERPRDEFGFDTFGSPSGESFPSGEVTQAFAIASVVAAHSDKKWVQGASWLLAGATAWQRAELDAHWGSDVVAGALLGASVGRWVVRRNRERNWSIEPRLGQNTVGLAVRRSY